MISPLFAVRPFNSIRESHGPNLTSCDDLQSGDVLFLVFSSPEIERKTNANNDRQQFGRRETGSRSGEAKIIRFFAFTQLYQINFDFFFRCLHFVLRLINAIFKSAAEKVEYLVLLNINRRNVSTGGNRQ